jgi:hypothetical protein
LLVCARQELNEEPLAKGPGYGYNYRIYKTQKGIEMKKMIFAVAAALSMTQLHAGYDGHFQLSVFSPGELPSSAYTIRGVRLSFLYGQCEEFYGLDVSPVGSVRGYMYGIQPGLLWNDVGADGYGLQLACVNYVKGDMTGIQLGLVNVAAGNVNGFQGGVYNRAADCVRGLQLGVMNWSKDLAGCQIGLANIVTGRSWSVWPIVNIGW